MSAPRGGLALADHSPLIDEVRKNNFRKVSQVMDPFIRQKVDSGTIAGRVSQERNRGIKNSYQTIARQRQTSIARVTDRTGATTQPTDYPGAVGPKQAVSVPKNFVMNQLANHVDAGSLENSISHTLITGPS